MLLVLSFENPKILSGNEELIFYNPYNPEKDFQNPPILAIHGMWATWRRWQNYGQFFAKKGWPFFALTLRYHFPGNETYKALGKLSVLDYVEDVSRLIEKLKEKKHFKQNPIIFGHSMGGLISLKLAERGLASGLVLLNSAPPAGISLHANRHYQLAVARYLPQLIFRKPFKPSLEIASFFIMNRIPEKDRLSLYQKMVAESGRAALEIRIGKIKADFSKINCPALVVGCENDRIVPPLVAQDIYKKLSSFNPNCEFLLLPKFAHWLQIEDNWSWGAFLLLQWLKKFFK